VINNTYSVTELRNKVNYLRTKNMRFTEFISENEKPGLWANIHAKRDRIKHGSGERMRKPGSKGAPTADALRKSATDEAANPAQQAAIAVNMKKHHQKPKGVAEGLENILSKGTSVTVLHKGKQVPGKIVRYDAGKGGYSSAYVVDIGEYESIFVPASKIQQGVAEGETWSKHNNPRAGGMSKKSVSSYRRSHPGSKIQTAVTTKPSKLKKGSKAAKRRASFCARMRGMKKHRTGAKTAHDPNSNINKSLRRWHCESIEELHELVMLAEQFIRNKKNEL
jgi:hypothetical protein